MEPSFNGTNTQESSASVAAAKLDAAMQPPYLHRLEALTTRELRRALRLGRAALELPVFLLIGLCSGAVEWWYELYTESRWPK